jgi:hypothetical protein
VCLKTASKVAVSKIHKNSSNSIHLNSFVHEKKQTVKLPWQSPLLFPIVSLVALRYRYYIYYGVNRVASRYRCYIYSFAGRLEDHELRILFYTTTLSYWAHSSTSDPNTCPAFDYTCLLPGGMIPYVNSAP